MSLIFGLNQNSPTTWNYYKKHLNSKPLAITHPGNNDICQQVQNKTSIIRYPTAHVILLIVGATWQGHEGCCVCVGADEGEVGVFLVVCIVIVSIVDLHYVGPYCHAR